MSRTTESEYQLFFDILTKIVRGDVEKNYPDLDKGVIEAFRKHLNMGQLEEWFNANIFRNKGSETLILSITNIKLLVLFSAFLVARAGIVVEKDVKSPDKIISYLTSAAVIYKTDVNTAENESDAKRAVKIRLYTKQIKRWFELMLQFNGYNGYITYGFYRFNYDDFQKFST